MKTFLKSVAVAILCLMASAAVAQTSSSPMTNSAVIKLVRAGFKEKTVMAIIHSRPNRFDLEPERLIELKRNGVSENIILAMLGQSDSAFFADDDWSFSDANKKNKSNPGDDEPARGDIFGGSSGSSGQTRGRGIKGANEGERTTTGSATVRILKPPPDENGAHLKLERTPTLSNESLMRLVDAGFSEGTIIKRIEESPADFDLSEAKIDELRRHRVTEPVISAMRTAMHDGPDSNSIGAPPVRPD